MSAAARDVAESGRWVATLSLDDQTLSPWRLFVAAGHHSTALMHAFDPPYRPAVREVEPT